MFQFSMFGESSLDGAGLEPGEHLLALSLFGEVDLDLSATEVPGDAGITVLSVFGATRIRLRDDQQLRLSGFSVFGERYVEPALRIEDRRGDGAPKAAASAPEPPIEVAAISLFGSVDVTRDA